MVQVPGVLGHPHMGLMKPGEITFNPDIDYFSTNSSIIPGALRELLNGRFDLFWFTPLHLPLTLFLFAILLFIVKRVVLPCLRGYKPRDIHLSLRMLIVPVIIVISTGLMISLQMESPQRGAHVSYFRNNAESTPLFEGIRPEIVVKNLDLSDRLDTDNGFLSIWQTIVTIEHEGEYGFWLTSDGRDRLTIDQFLIIDQIAKPRVKPGVVFYRLSPGNHHMVILHESDTAYENLVLKWILPGEHKIQGIPWHQLHPDQESARYEQKYRNNGKLCFLVLIFSLIILSILV
jgi:hypothetical protein